MIDSTDRTLVAWQRGIDLVIHIYRSSSEFPSDERFGMTQQIRRAAVSVPANIAEGRGRGTPRDYRHFLLQARGSLYEIETMTLIAQRIGYLSDSDADELQRKTTEVIRPLKGLIRSLSEPARRSP